MICPCRDSTVLPQRGTSTRGPMPPATEAFGSMSFPKCCFRWGLTSDQMTFTYFHDVSHGWECLEQCYAVASCLIVLLGISSWYVVSSDARKNDKKRFHWWPSCMFQVPRCPQLIQIVIDILHYFRTFQNQIHHFEPVCIMRPSQEFGCPFKSFHKLKTSVGAVWGGKRFSAFNHDPVWLVQGYKRTWTYIKRPLQFQASCLQPSALPSSSSLLPFAPSHKWRDVEFDVC